MRLLIAGIATVLLAAACNTAELSTTPSAPPSAGDYEEPAEGDDGEGDATAAPKKKPDAAAATPAEEPAAPVAPDKCPAPQKITLAMLPKTGFLPPVKVTRYHLADGDSGEFDFPNAPKQGVRSLWINTEEVSPEHVSDMGLEAKRRVAAMYAAAKDVQIAVQESSTEPGKPHLDPYQRWLALIFLDGELLQARIVREGLSAYYTYYGCAPAPLHDALLFGESEANENARGVWAANDTHYDYEATTAKWLGTKNCRPNPFKAPYCK